MQQKVGAVSEQVQAAEHWSNAMLYASPDYFRAEMKALAESCWHFFGTTDQFAKSNDWVRRKVLGVDLFVQNFGGELRGFHNVCQHRGFPLRLEPSGNGIVQCGYHAWTYNKEGVPLGVARNEELFCFTRAQKEELALPRVRVGTVGKFVFVALSETVPPLEDYLGRYVSLFRTLSSHMRSPRIRWSGLSKANWKLCYEVTLDEYHVNFVHPTTLGTGPAIHPWGCVYRRERPHSYLLRRRTPDWEFATFWEDIDRGEYEFRGYKIHHTFPNMFVAIAQRMVLVCLYSPVGPELTEVQDIFFDVEGDEIDELWWEQLSIGHRKVHLEDQWVSETHQQTMAQFERRPTFGALEQRVGWFLEDYERLVGARARALLAQG